MEFIGNDIIWEAIKKSVAKQSILHAYLFSGPANLGKKTLSLEFAKLLGCSNNDLHLLEKNIVIKINEIRDLQHKLQLSSQSKYKVAIIDDASFIGDAAANALLKTLEEPAKNTILILITANKNKILPTIQSRCQNFDFNFASQDNIKKLLAAFNLTSAELNQITKLSMGRPGLAYILAKNKNSIIQRQNFIKLLFQILNSDINTKFIFAEKMFKQKEQFHKIINLMLSFFRDSILMKSNNQNLIINQNNLSELKNFCQKYKINKIIKLIKYLQEINQAPIINEKLALENFFLLV